MSRNIVIRKTAIIFAWLIIWQLISWGLGNSLLFCGPIEACKALIADLPSATFWITIGHSLARIGTGFIVALVASICLGALAARMNWFSECLSPLINVVKSTPVICFITLLLVWTGSSVTTSIIVGLVTFPPFYFAIIEIHKTRNWRIEEMLVVYHVETWRRLICVRWSQAASYLRAAAKSAVGMAWKAGVAAELIGLPLLSIGDAIYRAKLSLHTDSIIAWTAVIILISWLTEKLVVWLINMSSRVSTAQLRSKVAKANSLSSDTEALNLKPSHESLESFACINIEKAYGNNIVFENFNQKFESGARVCIMAASGSGKTTLLRIISGLEKADAGYVEPVMQSQISLMFQETRLMDDLSVSENLALSASSPSELRRALDFTTALFPNDSNILAKAARELSGGMQRRVELARALAHPSSTVLLDEPFAGLDENAKRQAATLINAALKGRILIVATHDPQDAKLLNAAVLNL